jgi:hypothetical protein
MARLTTIDGNRKLQVCKRTEFERSPLWTEVLGPAHSELGEKGDESEPESEYILQRLIELYPDVLPWPEFEDSPAEDDIRLCVVCEGVSAAATDILLVERTPLGTGRFVIVETKLGSKNEEIHRKVVGQILEYAAFLSSDGRLQGLEDTATLYWKNRPAGFEGDFQGEMRKVFGDDWREVIWKTAFENLGEGNVRLLIVSDVIPDDLRRTVTFLPSNVLLSGIEIRPSSGSGSDEKLLTIGSKSAGAVGAGTLRSALEKYFSSITLSYAQVQTLAKGYVVAEAVGRNGASTSVPRPPFEEYLKALGGEETVPGQALTLLRKETLDTNGRVYEGETKLAFKMWDIPGLHAYEEDGRLELQFWTEYPLGHGRSGEVRAIFLRHFPDHEKVLQREMKHGFYFRPITGSFEISDVTRLVKRLSSLLEELHRLRTE